MARLIPSFMDANRNAQRYTAENSRVLDNYFGCSNWREDWWKQFQVGEKFGTFVTRRFGESMTTIGYLPECASQAELIRGGEKNLPLYDLAFFSRHPLGLEFWRRARWTKGPQGLLFDP